MVKEKNGWRASTKESGYLSQVIIHTHGHVSGKSCRSFPDALPDKNTMIKVFGPNTYTVWQPITDSSHNTFQTQTLISRHNTQITTISQILSLHYTNQRFSFVHHCLQSTKLFLLKNNKKTTKNKTQHITKTNAIPNWLKKKTPDYSIFLYLWQKA